MTRNGHVYTAARTHAYEKVVSSCGADAMDGMAPFPGPVLLAALFYGTRATGDLDNYLKSLLDGLQGVVFQNDRQVRMLAAWRMDGTPYGVRVVVHGEA